MISSNPLSKKQKKYFLQSINFSICYDHKKCTSSEKPHEKQQKQMHVLFFLFVVPKYNMLK